MHFDAEFLNSVLIINSEFVPYEFISLRSHNFSSEKQSAYASYGILCSIFITDPHTLYNSSRTKGSTTACASGCVFMFNVIAVYNK